MYFILKKYYINIINRFGLKGYILLLNIWYACSTYNMLHTQVYDIKIQDVYK